MLTEHIFANLPRLETEHLVLRSFTLDDAPEIFKHASDPEVPKYMTWEPHQTIDATISFIDAVLQENESEQPVLTWVIVLKETGKPIGTCSIWGRPKHAGAELGYWIGRPYWGKGLVSEAVRE